MEKKNIVGYYQVSSKENSYFALRVIFSILIYAGIASALVMLPKLDSKLSAVAGVVFLIIYFLIFYIVYNGLFVGLIKTQSVKLGDHQLPEIYKMVKTLSASLNIKNTPNTYLIQAGGSLNAFAKKFMGSNYVVIYSDLLEAFYEGNIDAVEFVVAHELGHIKRNHLWKSLLLFPSALIPFLAPAYNRACELTCDNIGKFFNAKGAVDGLLILAGGKKIAREINIHVYIDQNRTDASFWRWFAEKTMSHPALYKRLDNVYTSSAAMRREAPKMDAPVETAQVESPVETPKEKESDYSRYMPN